MIHSFFTYISRSYPNLESLTLEINDRHFPIYLGYSNFNIDSFNLDENIDIEFITFYKYRQSIEDMVIHYQNS